MLGGLIDDTRQHGKQRVPLLGRAPVVGGLFRYEQHQRTRTNLMVFIRTHILRDQRRSAELTGEKYSYMRARQLHQRTHEGTSSWSSEAELPVLPKLDDAGRVPAGTWFHGH